MTIDERRILRALQHLPEDTALFLATVVDVTGSAYRRPGAKLLLSAQGSIAGNISSGCVEKDLQMRIQHTPPKAPELVEYDTTTEEDLLWGTGVGCGGISRILLIPLNTSHRRILQKLWNAILHHRKAGWLAIAIEPAPSSPFHPGDFIAILETEFLGSTVDIPDHFQELPHRLQHLSGFPRFPDRNTARVIAELLPQMGSWLIEYIPPPFPLVIFGADEDVRPIAGLATQLGWEVTIVDHRVLLANTERFPQSSVVCQEPEQYLQSGALPPTAAVLLATHQYLRDKAILRLLLPYAARLVYCGILGPRRRSRRIFQELRSEGVALEQLEPILYFPTGLDIASETPEEIAISIIAEILAVIHNRTGGHLREQQRSIH